MNNNEILLRAGIAEWTLDVIFIVIDRIES